MGRDAVSSTPTTHGRGRIGAPHLFAIVDPKCDQASRLGSRCSGIGNRGIQHFRVRGTAPLDATETAANTGLRGPQLAAGLGVETVDLSRLLPRQKYLVSVGQRSQNRRRTEINIGAERLWTLTLPRGVRRLTADDVIVLGVQLIRPADGARAHVEGENRIRTAGRDLGV